jgi:glycosyltransferase involved in cell wall biosynthesis
VVDPGQQEDRNASTEAVVGAIRRFYEEPERRRELGERGREVFLENFEQETCCAQWAALLRKEVGEHASAETNGRVSTEKTAVTA